MQTRRRTCPLPITAERGGLTPLAPRVLTQLRTCSPTIPRALLIADRCPKAPPDGAAPVLAERDQGW